MKKIALLWAHFFFMGFFPFFAGTFVSLIIAAAYFFFLQSVNLWVMVVISALVFLTGIPASSYAEEYQGKQDPKSVVIDEVAGQLIALLWAKGLLQVSIAFVLFRIFDGLKPFPLRKFEDFGGGLGIMMDDVGAGLYSLVLVSLFRLLS